jgi:hypothetical protein
MGARMAWLRRPDINCMDLRVYLSVIISVTMCIMFDVGAKFAWRNFPALYRHPQRANSLKFMLQLVRAPAIVSYPERPRRRRRPAP